MSTEIELRNDVELIPLGYRHVPGLVSLAKREARKEGFHATRRYRNMKSAINAVRDSRRSNSVREYAVMAPQIDGGVARRLVGVGRIDCWHPTGLFYELLSRNEIIPPESDQRLYRLDLFIDGRERNRRIGSTVCETLLDIIATSDANPHSIIAEFNPGNDPAVRIAERASFSPLSARSKETAHGSVDTSVLENKIHLLRVGQGYYDTGFSGV